MLIFTIAVLALAALDSVLVVALTWRRIHLAQRDRRRSQVEQRLKPAVLAFLEGEGELPEALDARAQEILADVLGAYSRKLRGPASERIARYFDEHGTTDRELAALAGARVEWRRAAAAHRLGDIGSARGSGGLIAALGDESREVRTAAVRSLGALHEADAVEPLLAAAGQGRVPTSLVGWAMLQIGEVALPALRGLLTVEDPARRARVVRVLGLLGNASDADAVAERLRDSAAPVRAAAAQALTRIGGPRNVDALLAALDDRVPSVRAVAATALGRLRDRRALEPLLRHAQDDQFAVAEAAAHAVAALDFEAASRLAATGAATHLAEAVDLARLR